MAKDDIKKGEVMGAPVVASTTEATPHPADETSLPNALVTDPEQGAPVRTARPDVPIAQTLAAGAGEHVPPDPEKFGPDGRVRGQVDDGGAPKERVEPADPNAEKGGRSSK